MKALMVIETAHNGMYFSLTYMAALIMAAGIAIYPDLEKDTQNRMAINPFDRRIIFHHW